MVSHPDRRAPERPDPAQYSYYVDEDFYARLLEQLEHWSDVGRPPDRAVREQCETLLFHEARLLDERRYEEWLNLFTAECLYWIPSTPGGGDPRGEVSLTFDDRRRLEDRIARLRTGYAYSQMPPSRTCHLLTNIEVSQDTAPDQVRVRSNFMICEYRATVYRTLAGWYGHSLQRENGSWRIACKIVNLIDSDQGLENLSLVL